MTTRKTDLILQALDESKAPQSVGEIAAATGDADDTKNVGSLLYYLRNKGHVRGTDGQWQITAAGRKWIAELLEEAGDTSAIRESKRAQAAKARRERAADPEGLPPVPASALKANGNGAAPVIHGIAIEHGIPLPSRVLKSKYRDLAAAMDVGASVLLPSEAAAGQLRKELTRAGGKGCSRQAEGGYRTWRVA